MTAAVPTALVRPTARSLQMVGCHECGLLVRLPFSRANRCPRCEARIHSRKVNSVKRTWALLFAAAVLYVPANMLPIMTSTSFGYARPDTIISGILFMLKTDWPLAIIIFVASVMVPVLKILILGYLLQSVQAGSHRRPVDRTRLHRITEAIGRWSMVDIYVVSILVALVRLDEYASVDAEIGAVFFGAVVVLTMFAARTFDPRLIWDPLNASTAPTESRNE